jgi:hypothetical protein
MLDSIVFDYAEAIVLGNPSSCDTTVEISSVAIAAAKRIDEVSDCGG